MMLFEEEKGGGAAAAVAAAQATAAGAGAGAGTRVRYVQVEVQVPALGEVVGEVDDGGGAGRRSGGRWERKGMRKEVGVAVASYELWTECSPELTCAITKGNFIPIRFHERFRC
jgi:crotonobetainyl-CoA:carnitine CoA-transferase CaiB-like acyl-CoA transferase